MFSVRHTTISAIQLGECYRGAGGRIRDRIDTRISDDLRAQIRAEYKPHTRGYGSTVLAKKYGLSPTTIKKIVREK